MPDESTLELSCGCAPEKRALLPWPYGEDSAPIVTCLVCDEVGSWPSQSGSSAEAEPE